jgi:hypothetical protein
VARFPAGAENFLMTTSLRPTLDPTKNPPLSPGTVPPPPGVKSSWGLKLKNNPYLESRLRMRGTISALYHTQGLLTAWYVSTRQLSSSARRWSPWCVHLQRVLWNMTAELRAKGSKLAARNTSGAARLFCSNIVLLSTNITRVYCSEFKQSLKP